MQYLQLSAGFKLPSAPGVGSLGGPRYGLRLDLPAAFGMRTVCGKTWVTTSLACDDLNVFACRMHLTFCGVLYCIHIDNCVAVVSSSIFRRFVGTGVSGDSGAIAALQTPFAPTARTRQPRMLAKSDLADFRLLVDLAEMLLG